MKCIFLVAGYATRLFPLTKNTPKALLEIGGHPILDYILHQVNMIEDVDEIITVSNDKFFPHFNEWAKTADTKKKITVINDNTTDDSNKLGAVGDVQFCIESCNINDDLMVLAGDNLFTFLLNDFYTFFRKTDCDAICVHTVKEKSELQRMGVAVVDATGKVLDMEEKPKEPKSNTAVDPFYLYRKDTLPMFRQYLDEGHSPDAPGNFPAWLYKQKTVMSHWIDGFCIDIGTPENYDNVNNHFNEIFGATGPIADFINKIK